MCVLCVLWGGVQEEWLRVVERGDQNGADALEQTLRGVVAAEVGGGIWQIWREEQVGTIVAVGGGGRMPVWEQEKLHFEVSGA